MKYFYLIFLFRRLEAKCNHNDLVRRTVSFACFNVMFADVKGKQCAL
jgi:hypothetical protein